MFLGTHPPRLDDKGRLFLPAKFRERLAEGLVITPGQERCLYVFPVAEFAAGHRADAGRRRSPASRSATTSGCSSPAPRTRRRTSRAGSPSRRPCASTPGSTKDCVVIGASSRVEVWDAAAWDSYLAEQEPAFADLSEEVLPGVI